MKDDQSSFGGIMVFMMVVWFMWLGLFVVIGNDAVEQAPKDWVMECAKTKPLHSCESDARGIFKTEN